MDVGVVEAVVFVCLLFVVCFIMLAIILLMMTNNIRDIRSEVTDLRKLIIADREKQQQQQAQPPQSPQSPQSGDLGPLDPRYGARERAQERLYPRWGDIQR